MSTGKKVGMVAFVLLGLALATVAWVYLSGLVYLLLSKSNVLEATFLTYRQYWHYYGQLEGVRDRLVISGLIAAGITYLGPLVLIAAASRTNRELHGSARFATPPEVRKAGLSDEHGILVGKHNGKYLTFGGQQFVLLAAPTRAGKGVGVVIPNLLNFRDSVVVLDVKQENYDITAGFRAKHGQKVFLFNPFAEDMRTHRYNPLAYISDNPHFRIGDILSIGYAFWSGQGKDPFFDDQARNLFLGLCLYLCETPKLPRTMGELLRQSSGKGQPVKDYFLSLIKTRDEAGDPLSNDCVDALNRFCSTSDNTLASILASFNAPLVIWANPIVDAATAVNDFDLRDVRKTRMTVYIGITPDHLSEAAVLVNVLFSQLVNLNTKELPIKNPALKYQCLLLMDEFTAIGKVQIIAKAVSYMAGYNLRLLPIIQSVSQLASVYGQEDARTFITNHALQILYAPREQKDANEYSEMLGYFTMKNKSRGRQMSARGGRSENESDNKRALLMPQEFKEIGQWKEVIMLENVKPIMADKIRYFDDPTFTSRLVDAPAVPTLDLDKHMATVQERTRELTAADAAAGIDLNMLTVDLSGVPELTEEEVTEEEVKGFVDDFFAAINMDVSDGENEDSEVSIAAGADDEPNAIIGMIELDEGQFETDEPKDDAPEYYALVDSDDDDAPPADGLVDLSVLEDMDTRA